jgi:hypothetical protein
MYDRSSGPIASCSLCVANCAACSNTASGVCSVCMTGYTLDAGMCAAPAAALTDATFSTAIASCLEEAAQWMACVLLTALQVGSERCLIGTRAMSRTWVVHFRRNTFNASIGMEWELEHVAGDGT